MKNILSYLYNKKIFLNYLFKNNKDAILKSNQKMVLSMSKIASFLMIFMIVMQFFITDDLHYIFFYLFLLGLDIFVVWMNHFNFIKSRPLIGLYTLSSIYILFGLYLSLILFPNEKTTLLIGLFCFIPCFIIDKISRIGFFILLFFIFHSIFSLFTKSPWVRYVDFNNGIGFLTLGLFLGYTQIIVKLKLFDNQRLLTIEKEIDALTGLENRRKLFELISKIDKRKEICPSGVLMIDIDYFKKLNDTYGHFAGDQCLSLFGKSLLDFTKKYSISFYRYGGEEFVGFVYDTPKEILLKLAEDICVSVRNIKTDYSCFTVSIGCVYCDDPSITNYEQWIGFADKAVYKAKADGRNRVVCYE